MNTKQTNDIVFVAPIPKLSKRVRLGKFARLYAVAGFNINTWGWERVKDESKTLADAVAGEQTRHLVRGGGYSTKILLAFYPLWMLSVFWQALLHAPRIIHALGFEAAFPVALASILRPRMRFIYDDADRISNSYNLPKNIHAILTSIERWIAKRSWIHIIPGSERYPDGLPARKTVILKNTPSTDVFTQSLNIAIKAMPKEAQLVLYFNGWIVANRGAAHVSAVAEAFVNDPRLHILVIGAAIGPAAQKLITRPNITYLGEANSAVALAYYRVASLVLTFYDPYLTNNRYAEPNKWGDCATTGVPFVVNSEVRTAKPWIDAGAAFACPFAEPEALIALLHELLEHPQKLQDAKKAMQTLAISQPKFDDTVKSHIIPILIS